MGQTIILDINNLLNNKTSSFSITFWAVQFFKLPFYL